MTTIYLIRHGQASAGAANYDVLSPVGQRQAAVLGEYFRSINLQFNSVYSGNLVRQLDTATIALGVKQQDLQSSHHFNEYNHQEIFAHYLPLLATENEELANAAKAGPNSLMTLSVFTNLMNAWTSDQSTDTSPIETWDTFKYRVQEGIKAISAAHGPDDSVAVFTSGGVICTILHVIFNSSPETAFRMNWGINNAGITRIKTQDDSLHLREYNNVTHLMLQNDKTLITQI